MRTAKRKGHAFTIFLDDQLDKTIYGIADRSGLTPTTIIRTMLTRAALTLPTNATIKEVMDISYVKA